MLPQQSPGTLFYHIKETIEKLKIKKGGVDGIHAKVQVTLVEHMKQPFTHIINNSILRLVWPTSLKMVEVIPIHKSNEKQLPSNYRPI